MDVLARLAKGPVRGVRRWPDMMREIHARNVRATFTRSTDTYWTYELSPLGRRRRAGFRGRFA